MSVMFGWGDVWHFMSGAENTAEIMPEVIKTMKSLPVREQIKALADCPEELRKEIAQELDPEVRRKYNIATLNVDWSKLLTEQRR